jgi:ABC-type lipoprotein export system ATPase subunit
VQANSRPAAECVDLSKVYETEAARVEALHSVTASFPSAALTAVVGASGSGKSSLLRILAGLDAPTSGRVLVDGQDLGALSRARMREIRRSFVGYVFQRPAENFVSYLTLDEHLELARAGARRDVPKPAELLDELGLARMGNRYPSDLSGGEQQRAAFACAVAAGPRIVVADEPTAELDTQSASDLLRLISRLVEDGIALVLTTHDAAVRSRADEVLELDYGWVRGTAPADLARPLVRTAPIRSSGESAGAPRVVEATDLTKVFRRGPERIDALRGVSLELAAGRVTGLMGRSGSGKTTLLNVLAGWEHPDTGTVTWRDGEPFDPGRPTWAEVSVLPQKFGLIEELTVRENIEYPARLADRLEAVRPKIEELVGELDLDDLVDRLPAETSVGQQQRTGLARALVLTPTLLLADEPSGHQDQVSTERVFAALRAAADAGTSCLVATHNRDVTRFLDEVFVIENGRLADEATAAREVSV